MKGNYNVCQMKCKFESTKIFYFVVGRKQHLYNFYDSPFFYNGFDFES
jgi:hypothetical protein